jgi:GTP-binding protein HflX
VADAANDAVYDQISSVYEVLHEIGIDEKDTLLIVNKIDQIDSTVRLDGILNRYPNAIPISAKTREGFDRLAIGVSDALSRTFRNVDVETGVENGRLMAYLAANGEVLSKRYHGTRVTIHCRLPQKHLGRINESDAIIRAHSENGKPSESVDGDGDLAPSTVEEVA